MACTTGAIAILVAFFGLATVCQEHRRTINYHPEGRKSTSERILHTKDINNNTVTNCTLVVGSNAWRVFSPEPAHVISTWQNYLAIGDRWSQIELSSDRYPSITINNGSKFIGGSFDESNTPNLKTKCGIYRAAGEEYNVHGHEGVNVIMRGATRRDGSLLVQVAAILEDTPPTVQILTNTGNIDINFEQCAFRNREDDWFYYDHVLRTIQLADSHAHNLIVVHLRNETIDGPGHRTNGKEAGNDIWISQDKQTTVEFGLENDTVIIAGRWNLELIGNELRTELGTVKWTPSHGNYRIETRSDDLNMSTVADWLSASVTINDFTYTLNNTHQIWSLKGRTVISGIVQ